VSLALTSVPILPDPDYQRFMDPRPGLAVLVANEPAEDLMALLRGIGVTAIWPVDDGFTQSVGTA
jgi:hypothetical protein